MSKAPLEQEVELYFYNKAAVWMDSQHIPPDLERTMSLAKLLRLVYFEKNKVKLCAKPSEPTLREELTDLMAQVQELRDECHDAVPDDRLDAQEAYDCVLALLRNAYGSQQASERG